MSEGARPPDRERSIRIRLGWTGQMAVREFGRDDVAWLLGELVEARTLADRLSQVELPARDMMVAGRERTIRELESELRRSIEHGVTMSAERNTARERAAEALHRAQDAEAERDVERARADRYAEVIYEQLSTDDDAQEAATAADTSDDDVLVHVVERTAAELVVLREKTARQQPVVEAAERWYAARHNHPEGPYYGEINKLDVAVRSHLEAGAAVSPPPADDETPVIRALRGPLDDYSHWHPDLQDRVRDAIRQYPNQDAPWWLAPSAVLTVVEQWLLALPVPPQENPP